MSKILNLSVHELVDFLLRQGDIDDRVFNQSTMSEGTRLHLYHQGKQSRNYVSEMYLKETFEVDGYEVTLDGRADGVIFNPDGVIVDEIKSTVAPLKEFHEENEAWHLGQAKCYALMIAHTYKLSKVGVQLTYIHQIDKSTMIKSYDFLTSELEEDITSLIREYLDFYHLIEKRINKRNESAKHLEFPFEKFRKGQRELAKYSYGIAKNGGVLFVEAPTGIGKTMSTIYPFVKSYSDNSIDKLFYLTAKNPGKEVAYNSIELLKENGLKVTQLVITAKDKICPYPDKGCNPDDCPLAKGYYTKLRKVINNALISETSFDEKTITRIATHEAMCPFELSLDLSLYSDVIICDYNYFFDPMVYLRRFFDDNRFVTSILVDEAHNLVERGRSMYSASINNLSFKQAKKAVKHLEHKKIKNAMKRISKIFSSFEEFQDGDTILEGISQKDLNAINAYLLAATDVNKHHHEYANEDFMNFFFELNKFYKLLDYYDDTFSLYVHKDGKYISLNLFCLDPSDLLRNSMNRIKGKVIFSATLQPTDYYIDLIGGVKNDPMLMLPSPFKKDNLCLMVAPHISIKYKNRNSTIKEVSEYIKELVSTKVGNYFIYVPSYEYLYQLESFLNDESFELLVQEKDMNDVAKTQFLSLFKEKPQHTTIGLAVVGGAFGEGIDLVSDRLIGVIVIGVGLPQICFERDLIKDYFDKKDKKGFDYAYVDPGINKVLQAVGRVIRSENDRGVALLIDDRYLSDRYHDLFNYSWSNYHVVTSKEDIKDVASRFWKKSDK